MTTLVWFFILFYKKNVNILTKTGNIYIYFIYLEWFLEYFRDINNIINGDRACSLPDDVDEWDSRGAVSCIHESEITKSIQVRNIT